MNIEAYIFLGVKLKTIIMAGIMSVVGAGTNFLMNREKNKKTSGWEIIGYALLTWPLLVVVLVVSSKFLEYYGYSDWRFVVAIVLTYILGLNGPGVIIRIKNSSNSVMDGISNIFKTIVDSINAKAKRWFK